MVALRQYKAQNLNINPAAVAGQLAQPIDVDGVLGQISKWDALSRQQASTDVAQIEAENQQRNAGFRDATTEEMKAQIEAGNDLSQLDPLDIAKKIGDYESILKISSERRQAEREAPLKEIEARTKLGKLGQVDPKAALEISQRLGLQGWQAPQQKSKGNGKPKEEKPQVVVDPNTMQAKIKGLPEGEDVPLDILKKVKEWNENNPPVETTPEPEAGPGITDQVAGFLSSLTGGQATPSAVPSIPPGMKLQRNKATGQTRLVPING